MTIVAVARWRMGGLRCVVVGGVGGGKVCADEGAVCCFGGRRVWLGRVVVGVGGMLVMVVSTGGVAMLTFEMFEN